MVSTAWTGPTTSSGFTRSSARSCEPCRPFSERPACPITPWVVPSPSADERDERVSLEGLDPVEALKALLHVDPDEEPAEDVASGL